MESNKLHALFPLGEAKGKAFLGREAESQQLFNNVKKGWHTLILSPRRYGKSSLVKHALRQLNIPYAEVDLFFATDELAVEKKILNATQQLLTRVSPSPDHWLKELVKIFKKAKKNWSISIKGIGLEFEPENHKDIPENIFESLDAIESLLAKQRQKAIIFIDEIQEIANITNSRAIEGAIRHFAQKADYLTLIFSGSNQHMLRHMFDDKTRPLYALCHKIHLERLPASIYAQYFKKVAKMTWGKTLSDATCHRITDLTECHPRATYLLCGLLWDQYGFGDKLPSPKDVDKVWSDYIAIESKDLKVQLRRLSTGQIKLLSYIAMGPADEITGKKSQEHLSMSSSAISQALQKLENLAYIEKTAQRGYRIIDPVVRAVLVMSET